MASKGAKKSMSSARAGSATNKEAASIAASVSAGDKKNRFVIWPEWSDADVNGEKWLHSEQDVAHRGRDKGDKKSPVVQHFFDDPDGKVEIVPSLRIDHWKRPQDFITDKTPVIVDPDGMDKFDLLTASEDIHDSELMRWIISQITALFRISTVKNPNPDGPCDPIAGEFGEFIHTWRPWEHIYALTKVTKGPNTPQYNPHGKYVVKLYWMGCWRKIVVDDTMPFDDSEHLLLPATTLAHELWPMLLTKALIKVASIDYAGGSSSCEFGDFSVIHCLTGWLPETIPLHHIYKSILKEIQDNGRIAEHGHLVEIWELLKAQLNEWKLPDMENEKTGEGDEQKADQTPQDGPKDDKGQKDGKENKVSEKVDSKAGKDNKKEGKDKGKEGKKDKDKDKDKDKHKDKNAAPEEFVLPEHPEVVVFASYSGPPKFPVRVSVLAEMADSSERLRQAGLSHMYPHPVLVTQTRSCPLDPPPPPENIPAWKLIRPRKKKTTPSDEPVETPEPPKPIQCLEISSPFINYKVSPVPIPTDTHRPKSALERGGTRPPTRATSVAAIEETDENAPEPENPPEVKPDETPLPPPVEEPKETPQEQDAVKGSPASKPGSPKKKGSAKGPKGRDSVTEVRPEGRATTPKSPDRRKSTIPSRSDSKMSTEAKKDSKVEPAKTKGDKPQQPGSATPAVPAADSADVTETGMDEEDQGLEGDVPLPEEETPDVITRPAQDIWMDFDIFAKCFKTLHIFHKPYTYLCNQKHSDMKSVVTASKDRRSAPPTAVNAADDKSPNYLFVDNLKPTEIVVSFSSLSRWNEPPPPPLKEEKSHSTLKGGKDRDRDTKMDVAPTESSSIVDGASDHIPEPPPQPGLLVAEPYSWKSLVTGQPILRLRSTATRAAVLTLPEGRHVLRFQMSAPLGYHIHLCSSVPFVFGDEEKVMAELVKESTRFVDNATQVMVNLGKCITNFNDPEAFRQAFEEFVDSHCPYRNDKRMSKHYHHRLFLEAFYAMLKKALQESQLLTPEMMTAWRAFHLDCTSKNPLGLSTGSSRPESVAVDHSGDQPEPKLDHWINREITPEEHVAAVKVQKSFRGYWVRKISQARTPGTEENVKVQEQLQKAWSIMEGSTDQHGLYLFRSMFKADPDLMSKYPFHKDEWNKISFADYQGNIPDQPPGAWFVVFRDILYVTEEMLCVPKLYVPIPTCMLRVVNNDTGEEVPRVFQKVAPFVYKKNKRGYTFVAEARTTDQPLQPKSWRMRLIGSLSPLPAPAKSEMVSSFHTRELRDYYIPNERNTILRYSVRVLEDHLATVQMNTSKPDVYVKLQVLDNEVEVISAVGKGHVVIPAFLFQKDVGSDDESKRSSSRASNKVAKVQGSTSQTKGKRTASPGGRVSRSSSRRSLASLGEDDESDTKTHKYVIQAVVLRNSWPLSESSWAFVQMLKEIEKNDLKVAHKDRPISAPRNEKMLSAASNKGAKGKGKDKGSKDKDKGSRPPSQQFDFTKPNWLLRIVSDGHLADDIEVKKDTERADEIRAMKKAWEEAEPGRSAKAQQSRLKYLSSHMIKVQEDDISSKDDTKTPVEGADAGTSVGPSEGETASPTMPGVDTSESEGTLTLVPPAPPTPKEVLQKLDITPFVRRTQDVPRLLDEEESQRQLEAKQRQFQEYRAYREDVERRREQDRYQRNQAKIKQLEMCENMQINVDNHRATLMVAMEMYRQSHMPP